MALLLHNLAQFATAKPSARLMYDDYDGTTIPSNAPMVARYSWWTTAQVDRFIKTGVPIILIATQAHDMYGDVLDVENGDATASQTAGWIAARKKAGYFRPTIYTSRANVAAVRQGTGKYVLGVDYDLWVADWTNSPHQIPGAVATQYANVGTLYDKSSVYDAAWPHRTAPTPPPPPKPEGPFRHTADGTMSLITLAKSRGTTTYHLAYVTDHYGTIAERDDFVRYLLSSTGGAGAMPKGLTFYTTNP